MEEQTTTAHEPDLEKLRDERCEPVVRGMLNDMAIELIPQNGEETNYTPLLMKMMQRSLDADLNLQMENPYVFQLMLTLISGLNTTVQEATTVPIDDARYGAIAKRIVGILATANLPLGMLTPEQITETYKPVKEQLNALFAEEKLNWMEVKYVMDSILAAFKEIEQRFTISIDQSLQRAEAKAMGVETMSDITMKSLDKFLKEPLPSVDSQ